ncbi:transposase [Haloglycomyces albus]|uniref:transposase n=1 Tax=Haloglycomyces albus TaxID=526067 RepID=UPI00046D11AD
MAKPWEIDDQLWELVEYLQPEDRPHCRGTVPIGHRRGLQGLLFVPYTGIVWKHQPTEFGFRSEVTYRRRFKQWTATGIWEKLHRQLPSELHRVDTTDWSSVCVNGSHIRAKKKGVLVSVFPRSIGPGLVRNTMSPLMVAEVP